MEKVKTYLPLIIGGLVAAVIFIVSRSNGQKTGLDRAEILEKAREAKLAKSVLKKSEDEESFTDSGE
jgi:TRAP-type C4-dicarboxylate transport system permease small subunit